MVHLGPLAPVDDDNGTTPEPWALDHGLTLLAQTESRPGPLTGEGEQWMERQTTGKIMAVCQCGFTTGMVDKAELPDIEALKADHPSAWAMP